MNRIDLYLNALEHAFLIEGEIVPWPTHAASIAPYFSDVEARDLYGKLKHFSQQNTPKEKVGELFPGPTAIKTSLMDFIIGMKVPVEPEISVEERVWCINFIFDVIETMQSGDIFCRGGRNEILTTYNAQSLTDETSWIYLKSQPSLGRLAQKISAGALSLAWSLYFYAWPNVGFEIHGPYEVQDEDGNKVKLLIRDFFDLKPISLWPSMEEFPYNSIRILTLYTKGADLSIDIFNHLVHKANLLDTTIGFFIQTNGQSLNSEEEIRELIRQLLQKVPQQHNLVTSMSTEDMIKKFIESRYYVFRRLNEYFGDDWYPPESVLERISKWGLIEAPPPGPPDLALLRKAFDPRNNFLIGGPGEGATF